MKKRFLIIGTFLTFGFAFSQNTFPTSANTAVGIGTGTTAVPGTGGLRLKVTSGIANTSGVQLTNLTSASPTTTGLLGKALSVNATGNLVLVPVANSDLDTSIYNTDGTLSANRTVNMNAKNLTFNPTNANSQFFINGTNGNVGIGNLAPTEKLDVNGDVKANEGVFTNSQPNGSVFIDWNDRNKKCSVFNAGTLRDINDEGRVMRLLDFPSSNLDPLPIINFGIEDRRNFNRFRVVAATGGYTELVVSDKSQTEIMKVTDNGNNTVILTLPKIDSYLGIGTTNFTDGSDVYRLAVKGAIRAERVKVYTTWADFVFDENYNLPSLDEVEKHIIENGHLKDIPSAKEVEANGIELGEMNKKLLQKIEELTLYIIEMNKELKEVKSQIKMN
jgi:hypothetical protein